MEFIWYKITFKSFDCILISNENNVILCTPSYASKFIGKEIKELIDFFDEEDEFLDITLL